MKYKKFLICNLLILFVILSSCKKKTLEKEVVPDVIPSGYTNVLKDSNFKNGIHILGTDAVNQKRKIFGFMDYCQTAGVIGFTENREKRVWELTQWASKCDLSKECVETYDGTFYKYENASKTVMVDPNNGVIKLNANAGYDYNYQPRTDLSSWTHLLLEQQYNKYTNKEIEGAYLYIDFCIDDIISYMGEEYDENTYAAQFVWYFRLYNEINQNMLWFGVPLYDSREDGKNEIEGESFFLDKGTSTYIYCVDKRDYMIDGGTQKGVRYKFLIDIYKGMKNALQILHQNDTSLNVKFEDLYLNNINFGWEIPGTFDCKATIYDVGIYYKIMGNN